MLVFGFVLEFFFGLKEEYEKIIILVEGSIANVLARNFRDDTRIDR